MLLGIADALGLTLERLIAEKRLTQQSQTTPLLIGNDGTGLAAAALAWLHVNYGTTRHNESSKGKAWSTGLFLRLAPTELDGPSASEQNEERGADEADSAFRVHYSAGRAALRFTSSCTSR